MLGNKDPSIIPKLFLNTPVNNQRIYGIQFYNLGVPVTVVLDDYVPFYNWDNAPPAYSSASDNNGLWPIILEKAFSKFHGTYHAIEAGYPSDAIEKMTGFPGWYQSLSGKTVEDLWQQLNSEFAAGSMIAAGTKDASYAYKDGILNNHAYFKSLGSGQVCWRLE